MSGQDDVDEDRRRYQAPYTPHHTIPTIQKYRKEKQDREDNAASVDDAGAGAEDDDEKPSKTQRAKDYWSSNNENDKPQQDGDNGRKGEEAKTERVENEEYEDEEPMVDSSQVPSTGAKQKHKGKRKDEGAEREVTDPVTHLPVTIRDFTSDALKDAPENDPPVGTTPRTATGMSNKNKPAKQLQKEHHEMEKDNFKQLFPPPSFGAVRKEIADIEKKGMTAGLLGVVAVSALAVGLEKLLRHATLTKPNSKQTSTHSLVSFALWIVLGVTSVGAIWLVIVGVRNWVERRIDSTWDDEVWEANRGNEEKQANEHETESVTWLNSLLSSVWPLVNPDLFTSLADTLEDVMQASLPKVVQMVSVDDIGQGSESLRILGIRWLPTGAAARSVGEDGKLESKEKSKQQSDRTVPGQGEVNDSVEDSEENKKNQGSGGEKGDDKQSSDDSNEQQLAEGMEAEEGDFINIEVAFAYRARSSLKTFKDRTKDAHLYLAFYLPGNLKIPVWVDLRGVIGTMRLRLQLTPDPPFFALCTLTFLGQPKVDLSCIPLVKRGLNIMDLPLISNFVQSSVDAAMAEYVAPKSLTLDLKEMLAGDDFKKDTSARGVLVVRIRRGHDFKTGDPGIPLIKDGGADPYVSVGWAKFGKPMWSSRVLTKEMEPSWEEQAFLLVSPEELNVDERLRVQLWDADRFTADDDLGRIEIDLKQLMRDEATNGKMQHRQDGFRALKAGEDMPGKLEWDVGYFSKARIQQCQLEQQSYDPDVRSMEQLKKKVDESCERKMREANVKEGRDKRDEDELEQQKLQEMKSRQDAMIISAPPPEGYPSGIFSLQIHQITGLELEKTNKNQVEKEEDDYDDEENGGQDMPSAYCTVIINHSKAFRTRTKPKNAKPFYNAGVERFVPDWQNCEVYLAVRDSRVNEDDPLLGIVHLPLGEVFQKRSQVNGFYPLMGGVGFGRVRISMVWRSVQLQAPPQDLGWQYGTLEVHSGITSSDLPKDLQSCKIRLYSDLSYSKMYAAKDSNGAKWDSKKQQSLKLPFRKRYASCLALEFRKSEFMGGKTAAFAILWLRDLPDDEEQHLTLDVYTGDFQRAKANTLSQPGEKVGSINLKLTFWAGLGGAHSRWASKESGMREVVEVLQVSRDNLETHETAKKAGIVNEDGSDSDESDQDSSGDERQSERRPDGHAVPDGEQDGAPDGKAADHDAGDDSGGSGGDGDGGGKSKQNILDSAKDYKKHMKSQHRRNRGIMQWKIPRTAQWGVHKADHAASKVKGVFKMGSKEPGIETEV